MAPLASTTTGAESLKEAQAQEGLCFGDHVLQKPPSSSIADIWDLQVTAWTSKCGIRGGSRLLRLLRDTAFLFEYVPEGPIRVLLWN